MDKRLRLGDLKGNNFKLVIRNVNVESFGEDKIAELCEVLQRDGFINYFGLQRFGTKRVRTQDVGAALLAHKHERAVRLILGDEKEHDKWLCELRGEDYVEPSPEVTEPERFSTTEAAEESEEPAAKKFKTEEGEVPSSATGNDEPTAPGPNTEGLKRRRDNYNFGPRIYLEERDIGRALANLAPWHHLERALLQSLQKEPNSFIPALQQLPKNSLALYYHAAQSLIWNAVASARIARFGSTAPVVGDLVRLSAEDKPAATERDDNEEEADESADGNAEELGEWANGCLAINFFLSIRAAMVRSERARDRRRSCEIHHIRCCPPTARSWGTVPLQHDL